MLTPASLLSAKSSAFGQMTANTRRLHCVFALRQPEGLAMNRRERLDLILNYRFPVWLAAALALAVIIGVKLLFS